LFCLSEESVEVATSQKLSIDSDRANPSRILDFAQLIRIKEKQLGDLTGFYRAEVICLSKHNCRIQGGSPNCLNRGKSDSGELLQIQ
jgi:hypothetical protein